MTSIEEKLIIEERQRASFDSRKLTFVIYGGEENVRLIEEMRSLVEKDPIFDRKNDYFLTRTELYHKSLQRSARFYQILREQGINEEDPRFGVLMSNTPDPSPTGLHTTMFIPAIKGQGTPEQQAYWLDLARNFKIIGTYAQTELGHGTFIQGLETTATYDKNTKEFILNSPTLTSTKWWPGGLGHTSTHCILMARLIIDSKDYGIHGFIVQLRDLETHKHAKGVITGDIGPKLGFNSNDNGFLRLDNVRIPLNNMLMKYSKVHPDGRYEKPPHDKIAYGTMIHVRAGMVNDAFNNLARAVTIASRYSVVRRQGSLDKSQGSGIKEQQIIDYKTQQYRIIPLISTSFAMRFTSDFIIKLYRNLLRTINNDNDFSLLPETHATSAGLKALCSILTSDGIEECRKCCGGHGYSMFSGFPSLFANYVPACTYEGDNWVLFQQTARYLIKAVRNVLKGKSLSGNAKYLEGAKIIATTKEGGIKCQVKNGIEFLDSEIQLDMYKHRSIRLIIESGKLLQREISSGKKYEDAWNRSMVDLVKSAKAHCFYIMLQSFIDSVQNVKDASIQRVLKRLCDLFALYYIDINTGDFMEDSYLSIDQVKMIRDQIHVLLDQIRSDIIPIVDSFNISDWRLNSALGRYDGNVYHALYEWAQNEPLNKSFDNDGWKILKPLLSEVTANRSKL